MGKNIILDLVIDKFKEYEIDILSVEEINGKTTICISEGMIHLNSNKKNENEIIIAFHVSTPPDSSAIIVLILSEVVEIDEILIGDIFVVSEDKQNYYLGDDAIEKWERFKEYKIISNYVKNQQLFEWLVHTTNCGNA